MSMAKTDHPDRRTQMFLVKAEESITAEDITEVLTSADTWFLKEAVEVKLLDGPEIEIPDEPCRGCYFAYSSQGVQKCKLGRPPAEDSCPGKGKYKMYRVD